MVAKCTITSRISASCFDTVDNGTIMAVAISTQRNMQSPWA